VVDADRLAAIWQALAPLLEQNKFGALAAFRRLKSAAGSALASELAEAEPLVAQFQFDLALARLRRTAAAQGWNQAPEAASR
jgi:hypothetical protein